MGRVVDAELTEPLVEGTELAFFPEHDLVKLADGVGRVMEKPHQGQVEGEGEGQDLVGVEPRRRSPS